jgi:hypothetical protein
MSSGSLTPKSGLMEMPHPWKSANSADSHRCLGKPRQKCGEPFPHSHRPYGENWKERIKNKDLDTTLPEARRIDVLAVMTIWVYS